MRDLLVVGAGPGGLAAAITAARSGMSVAVLEPRPGPIDKACAEGLMPWAVATISGLGVTVSGMPFHGIRYRTAETVAEARFVDGAGAGVRRTELSTALLDRCADLGIPIHRTSAGTIEQDATSVRTSGFVGRHLAAADGLHSPIRHQLGLDRPSRRRVRHGLRAHFGVEPWSDLVEVHWGRDSEAYVTPLGPDLIGVAVLSSRRDSFEGHLNEFPELQARLRLPAVTRTRGASGLRQGSTARTAGRVFLVGDAAGYIDAITGEGVALAAATGVALADCLAAGRPQDYERSWQRVTRLSRTLTAALTSVAGSPLLRRAVVPTCAAVPPIFRTGVRLLAG